MNIETNRKQIWQAKYSIIFSCYCPLFFFFFLYWFLFLVSFHFGTFLSMFNSNNQTGWYIALNGFSFLLSSRLLRWKIKSGTQKHTNYDWQSWFKRKREKKFRPSSSMVKIVRLIGNCIVPRFVFVCVCVCIWIAHCWYMFLCDNFLCLFHNTSTTTTTTKDNHNEQSLLFILEHNGYKNVWCLCVCV